MRLLSKLILAIIVNSAALLLAGKIFPGFIVPKDIYELAVIALTLTLLNFLLKPLLKLLLGPLILITLGLGILIVNALILWVLDFLFDTLTIETLEALAYATILFTAVNIIFHIATKKK